MLGHLSTPELSSLLALSPSIDQIGTQERIARIQARSIKGAAKIQGLRMALSMIDLTTLEGKDTPAKVRQLCFKAQHLHDQAADLPTVAAVCVYPTMVGVAKKALGNSGIKVASVSTAFPSGQAPFEVKKLDTLYALDNGADEIDMVVSRGRFLSGDYQFVYDEIAAIKELCSTARLKVIFETGELDSLDQVRKISDLSIAAGADFIKTSTGKIQPAATFPVVLTMLGAIKDHFDKTGQMIGMKPAGGISSSKLALQHLLMVKEVLGEAWLSNEWYRFGASSLANDLLMQYQKQLTGKYQSAAYFSID
ncbi:MAG: deoxyribose-phosphate aldolase [Flavobacteriia bacterium]|jgi:deoxyribose-phosphate aldolase|nr:MAG: deoxyribose-phosphate aldolase [Flavobacteriia bacterium]